jgi:acetyl esterase/lipase
MMKIEKDVIYGKGGNRDLKLDIYLPDADEHHHTAVILLHGGAWRLGDKSMMEIFGTELAGHSFVALAPQYRLLGEAHWPAQIEDVKTAIRWTKANSDYLDIDPEKVVVQGFSAGGYLALMAGGTAGNPEFAGKTDTAISATVAAVVAFFPPVEFAINAPRPGLNPASSLLGESATEEAAQKASPINHVSAGYPPTFLLHGTADTMVSYLTSQRMFNALYEKGVMVELHLYPNHIHEFARLPSMVATTQSEIALFLKRAVVDPEKYIKENQELNMFAKMKH